MRHGHGSDALSRLLRAVGEAYLPTCRNSGQTHRLKIMQNTNQTRPDFRKALDGVVGARNREATRQISRPYEFQLIGAITKRPN